MTWRRWLMLALSAALFRGVFAIASIDSLRADPDAYAAIAKGVAIDGVFGVRFEDRVTRPTAFRPPLYPLLLSGFVRDGQVDRYGVAVLHVLMGVATALASAYAASRIASLTRGDHSPSHAGQYHARAATIAGVFVVLDPLLLRSSTLLMTETLAACLASLAFAAWLAGQRAPFTATPIADEPVEPTSPQLTMVAVTGFGLVTAAAVLCRPTFIVWVGLTALLVAASAIRRGVRPLVLSLVMCVPGIVAVGLWTVRNNNALGSPVWATTHGGYTLILANNPSFYQHLDRAGYRLGPWDQRWDAEPFLRKYEQRLQFDMRQPAFWDDPATADAAPEIRTEVQDDAYARDAAIRTIADDPRMFAWSAVVRVMRLWNPFPVARSASETTSMPMAMFRRYGVAAFYVVVWAALMVALVRHRGWRRWSMVPVITMVLTLTLVHAVYWSNVRMRAPAMPLIIAVAATAVVPPTRTRTKPIV